MLNFLELIKTKCILAIVNTYPQLAEYSLEVTPRIKKLNIDLNAGELGDYQFNSCMKLGKILQVSPLKLANQLVEYLKTDPDLINKICTEIYVSNPGFINFKLHASFLAEQINNFLLMEGSLKPAAPAHPAKKVIMDFSSPNIAKEMHVGHLRSTIIGDCLARILEFTGYQVVRINHIGDWGTQFGMLIAYLVANNKLTASLNLVDLMNYYKQAKILFDQDPAFKLAAQQAVVKLQQADPAYLATWENICAVSKQAYREIYEILNINITDRGESFYNKMLPAVVADFVAKQLLQISDGAKCIYLQDFVNREGKPLPLIIQKADGGYNYATTDLAAIKYRVLEERADRLIYVTDSGQALHFSMIFAAAKAVGYLKDPSIICDHVGFGLVLGKNGKKLKTREGELIKLKDLLDQAIIKAKELILARTPEIDPEKLQILGKVLGINAVKYADLATNRNSDYEFDYDKMLQFTGNTAAFLTYAYVRINSIKNKLDFNLIELIAKHKIILTNSYERQLALRICKFPEVLAATVKELLPNRLTDYLYQLAEEFHIFFHNCRVIEDPLQNSRLLLCIATMRILEQGFELLGLQVIDQM